METRAPVLLDVGLQTRAILGYQLKETEGTVRFRLVRFGTVEFEHVLESLVQIERRCQTMGVQT